MRAPWQMAEFEGDAPRRLLNLTTQTRRAGADQRLMRREQRYDGRQIAFGIEDGRRDRIYPRNHGRAKID